MHIALIIDDYLPHSTRVAAKMFHELACQYISSGHKVTVITPETDQKSSLVTDTMDGVRIWRFSNGKIKDTGKIQRALNETLMSYNAWKAIDSQVTSDTFDGIVYYSPSIFFGGLVRKLKQRCHCPSYLILRDLFPQWVVDAGMVKKGSLIERYFRYFEKRSYEQADTIGLMSEKNLAIFNDMTDDRYPAQVLRNWANLTPHHLSTQNDSIRTSLQLEDKTIFFYGGNIGHAQDMANLMRLVKAMKSHENAHFLFVGQGDEVALIQELAEKWELSNFTYLPSVNQEVFKNILTEVDIGLFSLASNHTAHNFPGKLLGYMVQSIPVLGSVNQGNDLMPLINQKEAGYITVNGDDSQLHKNALELLSDAGRRESTGRNAYQLLCDEFSVASIAELTLQALNRSAP